MCHCLRFKFVHEKQDFSLNSEQSEETIQHNNAKIVVIFKEFQLTDIDLKGIPEHRSEHAELS